MKHLKMIETFEKYIPIRNGCDRIKLVIGLEFCETYNSEYIIKFFFANFYQEIMFESTDKS